METDCVITKQALNDIVITDKSEVNIIDTYMVVHRNSLIFDDPACYVISFIKTMINKKYVNGELPNYRTYLDLVEFADIEIKDNEPKPKKKYRYKYKYKYKSGRRSERITEINTNTTFDDKTTNSIKDTTDDTITNMHDTFNISSVPKFKYDDKLTITEYEPAQSQIVEITPEYEKLGQLSNNIKFYIGYTMSPMDAVITLSDNLGLEYLYLLCSYDVVRHARYDFYRIAKKTVTHKFCVNHLFDNANCRFLKKEKMPIYMYIATNHLFMNIPLYVPATRKLMDDKHELEIINLELQNIEHNRNKYKTYVMFNQHEQSAIPYI